MLFVEFAALHARENHAKILANRQSVIEVESRQQLVGLFIRIRLRCFPQSHILRPIPD